MQSRAVADVPDSVRRMHFCDGSAKPQTTERNKPMASTATAPKTDNKKADTKKTA